MGRGLVEELGPHGEAPGVARAEWWTTRPTLSPGPDGRATYDRGVAILIDPPGPEAHGRRWSHLVSDTSLAELHAFARTIGIPERGFEGDHYDVPEERYRAVVAAGATPTPPRDLVQGAPGQRPADAEAPRRQGCRPGAAASGSSTAPRPTSTSSARTGTPTPPGCSPRWRSCATPRGDHVVVHSVRRDEWGAPGGWREPGESVRENAVREVREESGLAVDGDDLAPVGYERFHHRSAGGLWREGQDLLQVFVVDLAERRPALSSALDDTSDRRWVTWDRARRPLLRPVLVAARRGDAQPASRVSSRARFSRAASSHADLACAEAYTCGLTRKGRSTSDRPRGVGGRRHVGVLVADLTAVLVEPGDGGRQDPQVGVVEDDARRVGGARPRTGRATRCRGRAGPRGNGSRRGRRGVPRSSRATSALAASFVEWSSAEYTASWNHPASAATAWSASLTALCPHRVSTAASTSARCVASW